MANTMKYMLNRQQEAQDQANAEIKLLVEALFRTRTTSQKTN